MDAPEIKLVEWLVTLASIGLCLVALVIIMAVTSRRKT